MDKIIDKLGPSLKIDREVRLPGSKSITHRALIMAALAEGESQIFNPLVAEDTQLTAKALQELGVRIFWEGECIRVRPPEHRWRSPGKPIFLGNSGTSMRLLISVASAGEGKFVLDGTPRLRERPVGPIIDSLSTLGINHKWLGSVGYPPVQIESKGLSGGKVLVDATRSSQFLSSLLLAAPLAREDLFIQWLQPVASYPYVQLTLRLMKQAGIGLKDLSPDSVLIPAPQKYACMNLEVEGDCSSASYWWALAALTGGRIHTFPVAKDSLQGDLQFLGVLSAMGCQVIWEKNGVTVCGPPQLKPIIMDMNHMPDMVPTLAVLAAVAPGLSEIRNVEHLRIKESDRIGALANELRKFKVEVRELPDGLLIQGGSPKVPQTSVESYDDHRIAMAFAVLGIRTGGVKIKNAQAVAKSFPTFWTTFDNIVNSPCDR